ncbi:MAG: GspE/PulE family protein [Paracoccaceae bacterium]
MQKNDPETVSSLGELLTKHGVLDVAALSRAKALSASDGLSIDRAILHLGLAEEHLVLRALADLLSLPSIDDAFRLTLDADIVQRLGLQYLLRNAVAPVETDNENAVFLCSSPSDDQLFKEISFQLDRDVSLLVAPGHVIMSKLNEFAQTQMETVPSAEQVAKDQRKFTEAQLDGPVIAFVSQKMNEAVAQGASDIHFSSNETGLDLRFRINGILIRQPVSHSISSASVAARLKVMAGMNVSERRKPQDGRIAAVIGGRAVDFRVSALPTQQGESIVLRVLDPKALKLGWVHLGFDPKTEQAVRKIIEKPSGLFLVTGPTGSGKTTTLYTALSHLRSERSKIISLEDPVEYQLSGVEQVQVHERDGLGFAEVLRSVLRQDPNVIMIGEIRDSLTAEIACRAALVGRMVLSTLHTNSAQGAVARMLDLGVEEFILRDVLRGVLGQRLEPIACSECEGHGCKFCKMTGTVGRKLTTELEEFHA